MLHAGQEQHVIESSLCISVLTFVLGHKQMFR